MEKKTIVIGVIGADARRRYPNIILCILRRNNVVNPWGNGHRKNIMKRD